MKVFNVVKGLLEDDAAKGQKLDVLARFFGAQVRFLIRNKFEFDWINNVKLFAVQHKNSSTECYYYRYYDPMEMHFAQRYIKAGDVFADVGANIGSWALFAASCGAYSFAIEPTPSTFELLKKNVYLNPELAEKVFMVNSAVGDKKGELLFTIDEDTENHVVSAEEAETCQALTVPCDILDNICNKEVEIAKIDVENYELPALHGWGGDY